MKHIMAILISVFSLGYHGKTIDFEKYSPCHRTTVAHFLNEGKWDDAKLENILKSTVIQFIYKKAQQSGKISSIRLGNDISAASIFPAHIASKPFSFSFRHICIISHLRFGIMGIPHSL